MKVARVLVDDNAHRQVLQRRRKPGVGHQLAVLAAVLDAAQVTVRTHTEGRGRAASSTAS